jgi:chromatin remodeling complex protein RSC6|tara:strand:+ start:1026 stop:1658 length:633 start_codon:yes stop_codon:yes gene_type:complete
MVYVFYKIDLKVILLHSTKEMSNPVTEHPAPAPAPAPEKEEKEEKEEVDQVTTQFDGVLTSLTTFRSQITALQQQLRGLEKTVRKEMKSLRKEAAKNKHKGNRKPSGFAKPTRISDELCQFMDKEDGAEVARTEVTQFIIKYIREKELQNPENRKIIRPDKNLKQLLGVEDGDEVTYFNLQKYMNKHFHKKTAEEHAAEVKSGEAAASNM